MEGIGLDNMLGAEEVQRLFSEPVKNEEKKVETVVPTEETEVNDTQTAEVDFTSFIGGTPEGVGSGKNTGGNRETPKSGDDSGSPQQNLFPSIARALKDEGVFPDLSDETIESTTSAELLRKLFDDEVGKSLDERQKRLEKLIDEGASSEELKEYQQALNTVQYLDARDTYDTLLKESDEGEQLRKQVMYQDYINRGFKEEKAIKLVEKSIEDGSDIEDAKEAYESCKAYYRDRVEGYQKAVDERNKMQKKAEEEQYSKLKKRMLETESFYNGIKIDKAIRQKAYDSITKPQFKDEQGNYMTALQKYQRENPMEFMENVALLYSLTDGFKTVERLTKDKVNDGLKKGFAELGNLLNNSKRNGDGTLNLANTAPDELDRDGWTLAI